MKGIVLNLVETNLWRFGSRVSEGCCINVCKTKEMDLFEFKEVRGKRMFVWIRYFVHVLKKRMLVT